MKQLITKLGFKENVKLKQIKREEDESYYDVWVIDSNNQKFILKKCKEKELSIYQSFLSKIDTGVPKLYRTVEHNNDVYILTDYFEGEDLTYANKQKIQIVLDKLIAIQDKFWLDCENEKSDYQYIDSLNSRINRGKYLSNETLKKAYLEFITVYEQTPRTLCHDDLLPFNVLVNDNDACFIDWEIAGIIPYPTSLVRLIAHSKENEDAFFYMREEDKKFAIDYYYYNFIKLKNIDYESYLKTINYFLLYEYSEWIMLGEKYNNKESIRYKEYYKKALNHIKNNL